MVKIKNVLTGASNFFIGGIKSFIKKPSIKTGAMAALDVVPAGKISKVAKAGILVKSLGKGATNMMKTTSAQSIKKVIGKTVRFGSAAALGSYAITGELPQPTKRTVAGYLSWQLNPFASIAGGVSGAGREAVQAISSLSNPTPSAMDFLPKEIIDKIPTSLPDFVSNVNLSAPPSNVNIQLPQSMAMPSPSTGLSFSPSISAGGGMGEILPLLLLLGGAAGAAGYVVGRKKKKKYKRRKKRK